MPQPPQHISLPPAAQPVGSEQRRHVLLYMISGNPGLIGFYEPFLTTIRNLIDEAPLSSTSPIFHIYGQDLAGFSDADHEPLFSTTNPPRSLEYQIQHIQTTLQNIHLDPSTGAISSSTDPSSTTPLLHTNQAKPFDDIILIGHSVGSYIALELFHRNLKSQSPIPLRHALLLFPTITHISQSPSGRILDTLRRTPLLGPNAYLLARGLLSLLPYNTVNYIVSSILHFPPHASKVLVPWLKSRDGVWQALYMGMDEMVTIREDKWDQELWKIEHDDAQQNLSNAADIQGPGDDDTAPNASAGGSGGSGDKAGPTTPTPKPPKFILFFGQDDHWVADHYRDLFIAERTAKNQSHPLCVIVDEGKLPHAFCIHHSETMAEKVHTWVRELYPRL